MVRNLRITRTDGALKDASAVGESSELAGDDFEDTLDKVVRIRHEEGFAATTNTLKSGDKGVSLKDARSRLARKR